MLIKKLLSLILFPFLFIFSCEQSKLSSDIGKKSEQIALETFLMQFDPSICVPANHIYGPHEYGYCKLIFYKIESGEDIPDGKVYITPKAYFVNYDTIYRHKFYFDVYMKYKSDRDSFVKILNEYLP